MMRSLLLPLACLSFLLPACKKEPGEGGKSEIRGYVYEQRYNNSTCQVDGQPYPLAEARVYIMYGDHDFYDDDVRSGPDGLFAFSWLRKGDYKIYVVSECRATCDQGCTGSEQKAVYASTSVDGKDEVANLGTLTVKNY